MSPQEVDPEELLDGCDIDFSEYALTEEEQKYFPLFPLGTETPNLEKKAEMWRELGGN